MISVSFSIEELKKFKEIHDHCDLSNSSDEYKSLVIWSSSVRSVYNRKGNMNFTEDMILRLEAIGFKWILRVHYVVKEEAPVFNLDVSDDDFRKGLVDRFKSNKNLSSLLGSKSASNCRIYELQKAPITSLSFR